MANRLIRSVLAAALPAILLAAPLAARDSLGVFGQWGAFHDAEVPRCYAIAAANESRNAREGDPYASVGIWPRNAARALVHFRLSRQLGNTPNIRLIVGERNFIMRGSSADVWAADPVEDPEIIAAMRAASAMSLSATDARGRRFTDRYSLDGAASAIDAARLGCASSG